MATKGTLQGVAGALETIDGAAAMGKTEGLQDAAKQLRDQLTGMLTDMADGLEAEYARLTAGTQDASEFQGLRDSIDRFRTDAGQFAPRLQGEDPYRPNPTTQPGDPNPSAEAQRREMLDETGNVGDGTADGAEEEKTS